jgi:hypothetical protein
MAEGSWLDALEFYLARATTWSSRLTQAPWAMAWPWSRKKRAGLDQVPKVFGHGPKTRTPGTPTTPWRSLLLDHDHAMAWPSHCRGKENNLEPWAMIYKNNEQYMMGSWCELWFIIAIQSPNNYHPTLFSANQLYHWFLGPPDVLLQVPDIIYSVWLPMELERVMVPPKPIHAFV